MRTGAWLLAALFLTAGLAGCLGDGSGDEVEPTGDGDERLRPRLPPRPDDNTPPVVEPPPLTDDDVPPEGPVRAGPQVVVAHIDTGVNPYHETFRDDSPLAFVHPSRYIPGYPADVPALELTLDAASWEEAVEADADVWLGVERGQLYWIPGTRIVGAISIGPGGTFGDSEERVILDDHGHGTMTASRAVSATHSLAPRARLVTVEGLDAASVRWVADQGWIDVQTNSWGSLLPHPASGLADGGIAEAFAYAAERMVTVEASGNGLGGFFGVAPCSTYTWAQGPPGVVLVGAHDNGYVAAWSCSPPHVIADGFRPWSALRDSLDAIETTGFACCTSTSAPYAAGGAARIVFEARTLLGHEGTGVVAGVLARGPEGLVADGPLADGVLTLDEVKRVLMATAQPRPVATEHDGAAHWLSQPGSTPEEPTNPGDNPYCEGCWTTFVPYGQLPPEVPAYAAVGYGAINVYSAQRATTVLLGLEPLPDRAVEDACFEGDQTLRGALFS